MEPDNKDQERLADQWLDAALKQYGKAEPCAGLEKRVLANLQAQRENRPRPWMWRPAAVTVALCTLTAGTLFIVRRPGNSPELRIQESPVDTGRRNGPAAANAPPVATLRTGSSRSPGVRHPSRVTTVSAEPRLEQFPSPAPLSEEERGLVRYIRERPHEAALMARAQAELLKQDGQQFASLLSAGPPPDSQP